MIFNKHVDYFMRRISHLNKILLNLLMLAYLQALVQMRSWFIRFPTILQACESTMEILRGQYAHSAGCYDDAAFHFLEASKVSSHLLSILSPLLGNHVAIR